MGILSLVDWNLCGPFQAHVILVHSPILVICDSVSEKKKIPKDSPYVYFSGTFAGQKCLLSYS